MGCQQQSNDVPPVSPDALRTGGNDHAWCDLGDAGRDDHASLLVFHLAQAAGPDRPQRLVVAQCRDVNPVRPGNFENSPVGTGADGVPVNGQCYRLHKETPLRAF